MRMDYRRKRPSPPYLLVFRGFCRLWLSREEEWKRQLLTATEVAADLGMAVDTVRKAARMLVKMGYMENTYVPTTNGKLLHQIYKGYTLTEAGIESSIFKEENGDRQF